MTRILQRALTAWIAVLAILFGALAPALSHAFAPAAAQSLEFPICSAVGHTAGVKLPGLPEPAADPSKHCPYCIDQHHAPGLLPQAPAAFVAIGGHILPPLFYSAPTPLFHWAAPQSRAPPRLS
ncbi:DUF2946 domain-containing protein [Massilia litorea]|uniref:DUF2946 domain-containing protein n=1 Tax=Massilia litorea TaxID=2769491 RepID=A0A7L9U661_9BURK|nr:DUF2946 domain-containing protein [Massilia litorea]QOL49742.1 DUF2946 domain-containing protein [Massilia litorea]